jgi:phage major head subunit gpT-like protein
MSWTVNTKFLEMRVLLTLKSDGQWINNLHFMVLIYISRTQIFKRNMGAKIPNP